MTHSDPTQPRELISTQRIQARVAELADAIARDHARVEANGLLLVGVLKGAFIFLADLARALPIPNAVDFLALSSYGARGAKRGGVRVVMDLRESVRDRQVIVVGLGMSELDDYMIEAAAEQDRVVRPDAEPEKGYYYRSDHFSLAKQGVPALDPGAGQDHVEHGVEWTQQREAEYRAERYHMPADEMLDSWDLRGLVQDLQLFFTVGYRLSTNRAFPNWRAGSEFKALRDAMMLGSE